MCLHGIPLLPVQTAPHLITPPGVSPATIGLPVEFLPELADVASAGWQGGHPWIMQIVHTLAVHLLCQLCIHVHMHTTTAALLLLLLLHPTTTLPTTPATPCVTLPLAVQYWGGGTFCGDNFKTAPVPLPNCIMTLANGTAITGPCYNAVSPPLCTNNGDVRLPFGSGPYVGMGFMVFSLIILVELFGSPFMRNASLIIALLVGTAVAAAVKVRSSNSSSSKLLLSREQKHTRTQSWQGALCAYLLCPPGAPKRVLHPAPAPPLPPFHDACGLRGFSRHRAR
jgi:hypothetical protein